MVQSADLTLIVAAAGFGRSTYLRSTCPRDGVVLSAREALAHGVPSASWIGIDDLHELSADEQRALLASLDDIEVDEILLSSRRPLPPGALVPSSGRIRERGPEHLALDPYAVHRVLADEYDLTDPEVPIVVQTLTAGWPALVHLAADALTGTPGGDVEQSLIAESSLAAHWLRREVLAELSPAAATLLSHLGGTGPISRSAALQVIETLGLTEGVRAVEELEAVGVLTRLRGPGRDGQVEVVPILAAVVAANCSPTSSAQRATADALERAGQFAGAARLYLRLGDRVPAVDVVSAHGGELVRRGDAALVVEALEPIGAGLPDDVRLVYADALRVQGDLNAAARAFLPLVTAAEEGGWPLDLATAVAAVHYARGRLDSALDVLDRAEEAGRCGTGAATVEWLSARVHVLCSLGRRDQAVPDAAAALREAEVCGDPRALLPAHLAVARVSAGATREAHHLAAVRSAADLGDVTTMSRILVNHSFQLLAGARYDEAREAARDALAAADLGIATGRRAAALHNLAEALLQQGEYGEASWHLLRAVAVCRRLGAGRSALGLLGLAEIHRQLGEDARARERYLEAIELGRQGDEPQVLIPALSGLARVEALAQDRDVTTLALAADLAGEALRTSTGVDSVRPFALIASGWVRLSGGDPDQAAALAREASVLAGEQRALDLVADAKELEAAASADPDAARELLGEALAIWESGAARPASWRVAVRLGRLEGADATTRSRAREAARELQRLGVRHVDGVPLSSAGSSTSVDIAVLGGFRVVVNGSEVPMPAWRSRQARTLVKILAGRRGRPATRAWLCETLWPGDDPSRTGHRLSVLLATVRAVLDPEKQWPTHHFITADTSGIRLDLRHVTVDAELLVGDADVAARLMDDGEHARASEILADLDRRYVGDAFEDDLGEEWSEALREEARAAWQRSARRLASLRRRAGRVGDAQTLLVRLLAADPFDETIHGLLVRSLLAAGRRGEALRAFERWQAAMQDIGAPPPDPGLLRDAAAAEQAARRARPARRTRATPVVTPY